MNIFKVDNETKDRRSRRREHYLLSKRRFVIDNYFASNFNKPSNIDLTVSFNNPIIIEYQIKLFKKFLKGTFCHIICDNSNMEERAKQIKDICVKHNIIYIHCDPQKVPHGYADSHGIALNWIYKKVI